MNTWHNAHHNVTLTTSANGLLAGQFEITGYFYPKGFTGHRIPCYRFRVSSRAAYDAASKRIARFYGNTVDAAEKLFVAMKPEKGGAL